MNKKTAILGATPNPARYAYLAAERLKSKNHDIVPIGIKKGEVFGPQNQGEWEDYILSLNPKRIIFNPGSENPSLVRKASEKGIETINACTLVMLGNGLY